MKKFLAFTEVDKLAVVDTKDVEFAHLWDKESEYVGGEEGDVMELNILEEVGEVGHGEAWTGHN